MFIPLVLTPAPLIADLEADKNDFVCPAKTSIVFIDEFNLEFKDVVVLLISVLDLLICNIKLAIVVFCAIIALLNTST